MDRTSIERYAAGGPILALSIEGLGSADLDAFPIPGTWSIRQIVAHLYDSDLIGSDRMKRIIAEDHPLLLGYDESRFAERLFYHEVDVAAACKVFELNRALTAAMLRRLPDEAFERTGLHNEKGDVTLADQVEAYVKHLRGHLEHLARKRGLLGKPIDSARLLV